MSFATTHAVSLLGELHKSRDETGDFTLTCQGDVIKAHSLILSMGSEYFKTALCTSVGDNSKTIDVKDFSHKVLSTAVDFMYGIEIPEGFNNSDDLKSLLHMADLFLMEGLKDAAGFRIGKELNEENVFDTSQLADKFRAMTLSEQCAEFLFDNASTIEDDKLAELKEGTVMASLAKKFVMESKKQKWKDSWMTKLFGEKPDFKRRKEFGSVTDYRGYVKSKIKPGMFVSCNETSGWNGYSVKEGHVAIVNNTDNSSYVTLKWLTLKAGDPAYGLTNQQSHGGPWEALDLLTSPIDFSC